MFYPALPQKSHTSTDLNPHLFYPASISSRNDAQITSLSASHNEYIPLHECKPVPVAQNAPYPTTQLPNVTPALAATPIPGDFSASFPTVDTGANALCSDQTDTVRIAIDRVQENSVTYFAADVYVKNIQALKPAFAKGKYGKNIYDFPLATANENQAVFAITGDYYSARSEGIVVRNDTLYRDVPNTDVYVLCNDGEMKTYDSSNFNLSDATARGIWQSWSFGSPLLDENGGKLSAFNSTLTDRHPRCAIGYYAPGHYCFIVVDGRQKDYSFGMNLMELSALFKRLGCKQAYNFDGGATAVMIFQGNIINQPYKGGRESGDIICFA